MKKEVKQGLYAGVGVASMATKILAGAAVVAYLLGGAMCLALDIAESKERKISKINK